MKRENGWLYILVILWILVWGWMFLYHPITSVLPLGYDPGMYKAVFESYSWLSDRDRWLLPEWIQKMYPPFVWMFMSIFWKTLWVSFNRVVHSGIVWVVWLLLLWIYYYTKQLFWRKAALITVAFASTSFVLYNLYRRGYFKQLFALFFLLVTLWAFTQKKWRVAIPLIMAWMVSQRPVLIIMALIFFLWWLFQKQWSKDNRIDYLLCFGVAVTGVLSLYWPLVSKSLIPLISPFISKIGVSTWADWFQAGGTFLTIVDYLKTSWVSFFFWLIWRIFSLKIRTKSWRVYSWVVILLLLRVFLWWFFFQRLIGYLDVFLLVWVWIVGAKISEKRKRWWIGVLFLWITHTAMSLYRWQQIRYPIIEQEEFTFIQQINSLIEEESLIIVPWAQYSPWIKWWTHATVVAPWLFDTNKRWRTDWLWQEKRRNASPEQKCENVMNEFWNMWRKMYVWIWSKQELADVTWACFQLIRAGWDPFHALYRLDYNEENDENE